MFGLFFIEYDSGDFTFILLMTPLCIWQGPQAKCHMSPSRHSLTWINHRFGSGFHSFFNDWKVLNKLDLGHPSLITCPMEFCSRLLIRRRSNIRVWMQPTSPNIRPNHSVYLQNIRSICDKYSNVMAENLLFWHICMHWPGLDLDPCYSWVLVHEQKRSWFELISSCILVQPGSDKKLNLFPISSVFKLGWTSK